MSGLTLNDAVITRLSAFSGGYNEKQIAWLISMLAVIPAPSMTLNDLWFIFTEQEGFTLGTTQERKIAYMLNALGYSQGWGTANDIERAFWEGTLPPDENFRLTEAGDNRITEDGAYRELG